MSIAEYHLSGPFASFAIPASLKAPPDFIEWLPLAIYACRADGRVLWFNARAAELWGRRPRVGDFSELYCGSYKVYLDGRSITRDQTPMAQVLRTGIPIHGAEAQVERPDGSTVWATVHIQPVHDASGAVIGAINCFHESAGPPLDTERRLAATYEQAGIGLVEVDPEGTLMRANAHICNLLGLAPGNVLGQSLFDLTHPDDAAEDRAQYRRQVAGEIDGYSFEKRLRHKDGSYRWANITSRSVKDPEGNFLYAVRVQQDIGDRKRAEEVIARHSDEQAALYQLTAGLQYAADPDGIYASAMEAICRALRCQRAAVLLFDSEDVTRFVAWRGLSEAYRSAVEGHSPWSRDTHNPEPVCVDDLAASDLSENLKMIVAQEGIGALAFVPLLGAERLLGKFMIYYDAPHALTADEVALAVMIARHVSFAIERLRDQRAARQLAAIVESSDDAIVSKDVNGVIMTWNRGAEKLFGYSAREAVGQPIILIIPSDRIDEEPRILERIRRGERVEHFETVRQRKDGSLIDISLTISPIRDPQGRIVGASKIARDITRRKQAEIKLRESERRLQELLSAIPAALYTTDASGKITYYNEAAVKFAGREPTLGSDEWCVTWKLYTPDGKFLPHDQCPMAIALKEGRPVRGVEAVAERPDGTRVPFIPYPTPLRDANGKVVGAINMLVDVSQRKEAETQQRILLNELNHRVKNNMQMLHSLLSSSARQSKSPEARRTLEEATARIAAMAAAQRALYSGSSATRFTAPEFLRAVCETAQQAFPPKAEISCSADPMELANDVAMPLALILNELLTNAVKHGVNADGGGTIRVTLKESEHRYILCVEDDGPGFDFDATRARSSGLFLIQGLARQLGGKFVVSRSPTRCSVAFGQGLAS
jgi:PAS domain S-box-containing protein